MAINILEVLFYAYQLTLLLVLFHELGLHHFELLDLLVLAVDRAPELVNDYNYKTR